MAAKKPTKTEPIPKPKKAPSTKADATSKILKNTTEAEPSKLKTRSKHTGKEVSPQKKTSAPAKSPEKTGKTKSEKTAKTPKPAGLKTTGTSLKESRISVHTKAKSKPSKPNGTKKKTVSTASDSGAPGRTRNAISRSKKKIMPDAEGKPNKKNARTITTRPVRKPSINDRRRKETVNTNSGKLKSFFPWERTLAEPKGFPSLPEEYGENELFAIEVDPSVAFVSWEIKKEEIKNSQNNLILRVHDVTGRKSDRPHPGRYFDIPIENRIDNKFFRLEMYGKDVIMEIGVSLKTKGFRSIVRSNRLSFPELRRFEETGMSEGTDETVGYK